MKKILIAALLFSPTFAFAEVRINEIAWMGTAKSSTDEWIELYNDGDSPVDVSNWILSISTKKLSGTIQAKGYYLLERTDDTTVPGIAADFIYTGEMNNNGIRLVLKNASGAEADSIDATSGWQKGNSDTKETMQRNGSEWITAAATPKAENKTADTTKPAAEKKPVSSGSNTGSNSNTPDTSAHASPLPLSDFSQKQELSVSAGRNRIAAVGNSVVFETYAVDAKGGKTQNVSSLWSFGDGLQTGGSKVSHVYKYPGDYAVVLNVTSGENQAVSRAEVKVFSPEIAFEMAEDGTIFLTNNSSYELNIGGWKISGTAGNFVVAPDTIIETGKKITFSKAITGIDFSPCQAIDLLSADNERVSSFAKTQKTIMPVATTTPVEIPVVSEKKIEPVVLTAPVISKPKTETAAAVIAIPPPEKEKTVSVQKITLKKPDGFFAKIWKMFF